MTKDKIIFGGFDTFAIDHIWPRAEIIDPLLRDDSAALKEANRIYEHSVNVILADRPDGSKFGIDAQTAKEARKLSVEMEAVLKPYGIEIRGAGGTVNNKIYNVKSILGDKCDTFIIGALGDDLQGEWLRKTVAGNGIRIIDNNEMMPSTRENFIITRRGATDRGCGKAPYAEPQFYKDHNKVLELTGSCDHFFLEASPVKFWGAKGYYNFAERLSKNGTNIIGASATDRSFLIDESKAQGVLKLRNLWAYKETYAICGIYTMNEAEAIWLTGVDRMFKGEISGISDDRFQQALFSIKNSSKKKPEQITLITAGKHGMITIMNGQEHFCPATEPSFIFNTVGAGDSAAGAFVARICSAPKHTKEVIHTAMEEAANLASVVISQNPPQIEAPLIIPATKNIVPVNGKLNGIIPSITELGVKK